jgi:ADP-ribosyl-[dinitrogen reductase] hydrolase
MTEQQRARGCLLGLACGDAMGRPIEFKSAEAIDAQHGTVTEMLGHGTHGQPAGTLTDDTEMALCIADSLVDRRGFDPADIADRFVAWLDSDPFDIGLMTQDALTQLQQGTPWHEAGVDVWNSRPEGSNAGNGSVMRCAPHAIAFRHVDEELTHVSRLSSAITHADPRCQWGCVVLNRTLAALICDESEPLGTALTSAVAAPDELRTALQQVQAVVAGERDRSALEAQLSTSGYVVDSLQAGLYFGLTADSVEGAIVQAVNSGGDTDTVGAITGAVAGARFGADAIPDRWTAEIEDVDRLEQVAQALLTIRLEVPGTEYGTVDDGSLLFKQRTVDGPAYISIHDYQPTTFGYRPDPPPHWSISTEYHNVTPQTAAMLDWERRAHAVQSGRCPAYTGPQLTLDDDDDTVDAQLPLVPVPQYPFADAFDDLPMVDQRRITRDGRAAAAAFVRAYAAFAVVRHPITETGTEDIGIERTDPIVGATRMLVKTFGDAGEALMQTSVRGGYDSSAEIEEAFDTTGIENVITDNPRTIDDVREALTQLASGCAAILDYVTQFRLPQQQPEGSPRAGERLEDLRTQARTMVGELHVAYESLQRVAVRHPGVEYDRWRDATAGSGGR